MNTLKTSLIATLLALTSASVAYAQAPADAPKGERAQKMLERIKAADTNSDGKISREEANASLPRIAKNFDTIDANKDGFVTMDELHAAGGKGGKGERGHKMHEHMKAADTNGDGKFSRDEANASMPRIAKNFDAIDANKDGFVTKEELRAFHEANGGRK
jgi:Ca2+-binding EF-hand superfamily protein